MLYGLVIRSCLSEDPIDICNNQDQLGGLTERLGLPANDFADVSSIEIGF